MADVLAPTLESSDIVIMDNLPAHNVRGIRAQIEAVGARLLYLPSYSPAFNPNRGFAKLKALLRSAAVRATPDLWDAIRRSLTRFAPAELSGLPRYRRLRRNLIGAALAGPRPTRSSV